ncbi:fasciclin domain-containing protein [Frigidibacter sp. RF13]|uniref:fasciclin domain-containing protein n=1 Tax=Frigidibacter sp. RF13 TaxID=2997340 RepID=UPI00226D78C9|nr:fasciclin domain-containing protein [Frigidibacter sp. RF13]MCY1127128.1 fasciclin domain-containing protein [Frigidibacter sp. RF13]
MKSTVQTAAAALAIAVSASAVQAANIVEIAAGDVVVADIMTDNGVIHEIDKVLLPGERPTCR